MITKALSEFYEVIKPKLNSPHPEIRREGLAAWQSMVNQVTGVSEPAPESPEERAGKAEVERLRQDKDFMARLGNPTDPVERRQATEQWMAAHRRAYGATSAPSLPDDPEGFAARARNDVADIASGLTGGELRRALVDRAHPAHKRAVELWEQSHQVGFGTDPLADAGASATGSMKEVFGL